MAKSTRDILLDFTFEEVHKYGYFQASTSDILKKCNIPKGSMYHYFSSKEDLVLAVIKERVLPKSLRNYRIKVQKDEGHFDALIRFIEEINFSKKAFYHGCVMHKLIVEMSHLNSHFKDALDVVYTQVIAHFAEILDTAIEHGEIKRCDSQEKAHFVVASLLGAISTKDTMALEALIKELRGVKALKKQTKEPRQQTLF